MGEHRRSALDVGHHLVLPSVTLVAVVCAEYLLVMRSSLLEEMHAPYLTTARAKGLRDDLVAIFFTGMVADVEDVLAAAGVTR